MSDRVRYSPSGSKTPFPTCRDLPGFGVFAIPSLTAHVANKAIHDARQIKLIETLRVARKRKNLTQVELAAKLGRRQQFVSKYESGERRLDFIEVLDVSRALGLGLERLVREVDDWDAKN